jgi:ubiquinone/menaquinone biosynthesis C-methylase UbiE
VVSARRRDTRHNPSATPRREHPWSVTMSESDWDYRGLVAETYDLWFGEEPFWDQAFFHHRLAQNGGTALEIACGTGRLLVPFLRDGLSVEGVDASEDMLAICRAKAIAAGVTPILHHQLMQKLALDRRYQTLFIPAGSFQILAGRAEAITALQRFCAHLEPDGELLVTLAIPWRDFAAERQWRLRRSGVRPTDGATVLIHEATSCDQVDQLQHLWLKYEVFKEGTLVQSELKTHRLRWYHQHEFVKMLESVGFREIAVRCGYRESETIEPDADMIFSARR